MGLASVVKGLGKFGPFGLCHAGRNSLVRVRGFLLWRTGVASLKQHQIVGRVIEEASSPHWEHREGSLLCVEELCLALGRLFEPYIVQILEVL